MVRLNFAFDLLRTLAVTFYAILLPACVHVVVLGLISTRVSLASILVYILLNCINN